MNYEYQYIPLREINELVTNFFYLEQKTWAFYYHRRSQLIMIPLKQKNYNLTHHLSINLTVFLLIAHDSMDLDLRV